MSKQVRVATRLATLAVLSASPAFAKAQARATEHRRIILPLELAASQPATLAVVDTAGHVSSGVKVVLSSGQVIGTDQSGRAHFLAPPDAGVMFARVLDSDEREAADVVSNGTSKAALQITSVPKIVSITEEFSVGGRGFQGDADRNRIEIGGKSALVLASSPVELILVPPLGLSPGLTDLRVTDGAESVTADLTLVQTVTQPSDALIPGKRTKVILRAEGTSERLRLRVKDLTPKILGFQHGNQLEVRTSGGQDNLAAVPVKAIGIGNYSVGVSLDIAEGNANVPAARDFLLLAEKVAPPDALPAVQRALKHLQNGHADATRSHRELTKISDLDGSGDFPALIRAALRALRGS